MKLDFGYDKEIRSRTAEDDDTIYNWETVAAIFIKVVGFIVMVAIFAQCESGRIW